MIDIASALGIAAALVACGGSANPMPAGTQLGLALSAAMKAADHARAPWRCAASDGPALTAETLDTKPAWKLEGHVMSREGDGPIVIAAIADAGGAAPPTLAALGRMRPKLANADVVIALGGMGTTTSELEATLGEIADKAPVIAMPGDLEDAGDLAAAIVALRAKGKLVIDGRLVQRIEIGSATVGLASGAGAVGRLVAGAEGCAYTTVDVIAIARELSTRKGVRILASAEAPRDVRGGEPTGELDVTVGAPGATSGGSTGATTAPSGGSNGASGLGSASGSAGGGSNGTTNGATSGPASASGGSASGASGPGSASSGSASGASGIGSASGGLGSASGASRPGSASSGGASAPGSTSGAGGASGLGSTSGASGAGARAPTASGVIEIDIALHGPMAEAATRAKTGGRDGNTIALTPGTLDATPRLPDPARAPTAGLLVIRGEAWSWKPITDGP